MATPLYPIFQKRVTDAISVLIRDQVTPWTEIVDTGPFRLKGYQGTPLYFEGKNYIGRAQTQFWTGYIEPFLEHLIVAEVTAAANAAEHRGLDPNAVLAEVEDHLRAGVRRIYHEMARIDQAIVRLDVPGAGMRSTDGYIAYMDAVIAEKVRAERTLWGRMSKLEIWHMGNRFWAWAITTLIATLAFILGIVAVLK